MGAIVHCRTGSLESREYTIGCTGYVHCRTGSLEKFRHRTHLT
uniref:Uncharacterized protein n=1 Tax=Methylophaga nitratireducenticrescens TaxID=754476 RepID=I1XLX0_METNJ